MKKYKAKKGRSMGIFLSVASMFVFFVGVIMPILIDGEITQKVIVIGLAVILPIMTLFIWVWFGTYYLISNDVLKATSGPFNWRIKVQDINKIKLNQPTILGIIKFSLSFRSIEVIYKKYDSIFIMPENQDEFIQDLKSMNPNIVVS
jgi:hypothetical protein